MVSGHLQEGIETAQAGATRARWPLPDSLLICKGLTDQCLRYKLLMLGKDHVDLERTVRVGPGVSPARRGGHGGETPCPWLLLPHDPSQLPRRPTAQPVAFFPHPFSSFPSHPGTLPCPCGKAKSQCCLPHHQSGPQRAPHSPHVALPCSSWKRGALSRRAPRSQSGGEAAAPTGSGTPSPSTVLWHLLGRTCLPRRGGRLGDG